MEDNRTKQINQLLNIIYRGTNPNETSMIFEVWKNSPNARETKPIFNLFADAFLSLHAYSTLMLENCWSQAGMILRAAIEQVSTLFVLSNYESTISDFIRINKLKTKYFQIERKDEQAQFLRDNDLPTNKFEIIKFFDYGWIVSVSETVTRDDVIRLAHLDEMIDDIKDFLNPFAHGKLTIFDFAGPDGLWSFMRRYGKRANMLCAKLFDFWCCAFKKWSNEMKVDEITSNLFVLFKKLYLELL